MTTTDTTRTSRIPSNRVTGHRDAGAFANNVRPPAAWWTPTLKKLFAEYDKNVQQLSAAERELSDIEENWSQLETDATAKDSQDAAEAMRTGKPFKASAVEDLRRRRRVLQDTITATRGAKELISLDLAAERLRIQDTGELYHREYEQRAKVALLLDQLQTEMETLAEAIALTEWLDRHTPFDTSMRLPVRDLWEEISTYPIGNAHTDIREVIAGLRKL